MSLSKRNTAIVCSIVIAVATCGLTPKSNADIIHESANMGPADQWPPDYQIFDTQFLGSRFEITEPTEITAIGGHIGSAYRELLIFGAIVNLDNNTDFPNGYPFWSSDVVEYTYFRPLSRSADIRTPLNVILQPGWYGLVFGAGEFSGLNDDAIAFMPGGGQSSYPGSSYFHWNGFTWVNTGYSSGYPRFVVEGQPVIPPVEIYGTKFDDIDGNGVWDPGEPNMPGWEIYLDENGNGVYDASEPNVITDSGGMYRFTDLDTPVTYRVREVTKDGWTQTLPGGPDNEYVIFAEPNNIYGPYDFGNTDQPIPTGVKLSGYVRTSLGVRIKGINISAGTGETTVTDALGYYELTFPSPFNGTITPSQTDWTFSPASRTYSNTTTDQPDQDFTGTYSVSYGGGAGTSLDPYLIYTAEQMNAIGTRLLDWDNHFKLMDNIDLGDFDGRDGNPSFNRIGYYINFVGNFAFTGVFDGNGHTVHNFTFDSDAGNDGVAIFGYVTNSGAQIKNVKLHEINVNSTSTIGTAGLIGFLSNGTISGCSVESGSAHGYHDVGGLVGSAFGGTISDCGADDVTVSGDMWVAGLLGGAHAGGVVVSDCSASCSVTAKAEGGGLIGRMGGSTTRCTSAGNVSINYQSILDRTAGGLVGDNSGTIDQCYSTANVVGNGGDEIGGLVGRNGGIILNSFAMGDVSGTYPTGGLIGLNWETFSEASITNCYSTGASTGGGLIGWNVDDIGLITNSFWDKQTSGTTFSDGGTGLMTADMQARQTFLDAGWDFVNEPANGTEDIWRMPYGAVGSPQLWWQRDIPGDWVGKYGVGIEDYGVLAGSWMNINAEINLSGLDIIDFEDLTVFLGNWSAGR